MKSHLFALVICLAGSLDAYAQRWEKVQATVSKSSSSQSTNGSKPYTDDGYNYGSATNPSPRMDAVTWTDLSGTLWVFGGIGLDEKYQWGMFQDMWNYIPETNSWNFISGIRNTVSEDLNFEKENPKPRKEAAAWTDAKGNLWLYGGKQLGDLFHLDDLWKFDVQSKSWSKISGDGTFNNKPSRGAQKSVATDNSPGGRSSCATWTDKNGNLWLFGGISYEPKTEGTSDYLNDLWMYDTNKNKWSWIVGSEKSNQPAVIDSKSENVSRSIPGSRSDAAFWFDEQENQLWLYGGIGMDSTASNVCGLSDMWVFSIETNSWQLKSGNLKPNLSPTIFSGRTEHKENSPGSRISSVKWIGKPGNLYLVGGNNNISHDEVSIDKNIWIYSTKSNQWRVLSQTEIPSISSGTSLKDSKDIVYLFGGKEFDEKTTQSRVTNAIWKINP